MSDLDRTDRSPPRTRVNASSHFDHALRLHQSGQTKAAAAAYRRAIAETTDHADAHHLLGVIALRQGLYAQAVRLIVTAVLARPHDALYARSLGVALMGSGDAVAAARAFTKAIRLRPDYPEAYHGLGVALRALSHYRAAAWSFYRALLCRPRYAQASRNYETILSRLRPAIQGQFVKPRPNQLDRSIRLQAAREANGMDEAHDRESGFTVFDALLILTILSLITGSLLGRGPFRNPSLETRVVIGDLAHRLRTARMAELLSRKVQVAGAAVRLPMSIRVIYASVAGCAATAGRIAVASRIASVQL
jgi:tetratricopeptide (TPR) repeat protein